MNLDGNFPSYEQQEAIKTAVANISTQIENKNTGKVLKSKTYTSNGTFNIPAGVTEIYVTGGGGGGGGGLFASTSASDIKPGQAGGVSSVGNLLTLNGGGGGGAVASNGFSVPGAQGGLGGQAGGTSFSASDSNHTKNWKGGDSGPYFGGVAMGIISPGNPYPAIHGGYCSGGAGLASSIGGGLAGGGGADFVYRKNITVTPSSVLNITIGLGGAGGTNGSIVAGRGGSGIITIEWWE